MLEQLVAEFGEKWRRLITDALGWLDGRPELAGCDRREFVRSLLERAIDPDTGRPALEPRG